MIPQLNRDPLLSGLLISTVPRAGGWTELPQRRTQPAGTHWNALSVIKLDVS